MAAWGKEVFYAVPRRFSATLNNHFVKIAKVIINVQRKMVIFYSMCPIFMKQIAVFCETYVAKHIN